MPRPRCGFTPALLAVLVLSAALVAGCGAAGSGQGASSGKLSVVAAEDFWGSIAAALGGKQVEVTSIITNPSADPHEYEPTSADARSMAGARIVILNGIGYDEWASKLLAADPNPARSVLNVGEVLGLKTGENPHQWYSPSSVGKLIAQISAAYKRADPSHSAYFEHLRSRFQSVGLRRYYSLISAIRSRFGGDAIGASESIVAPLAPALGLRLLTPPGFLDAIAEGTEPTPAARALTERQIAEHQIKIWIYNSQNATPDVQRLNDAARAAGIPIATVSETLRPEGASFSTWMSSELLQLRSALARAARR
jgi:zinc/manganese transport system substrate-binding protein